MQAEIMKYMVRKIVHAELIDLETGRVVATADTAEGIEGLYTRRRELALNDIAAGKNSGTENSIKTRINTNGQIN